MEEIVRELPADHYIVHAAQHAVEHCFTLVVQGPSAPVMIYDDFNDSENPPCRLEPLLKLEWLMVVYALYCVAIESGCHKHSHKAKKKPNKKRKIVAISESL
ncbi:hypothetical protein PHYPSEUDO_011015 [Phytophthora pseudosyringae]|uniref:Uncharacterized protein n=1 Tax=Phytophthora pseudosyringae TaxID=221518 RepID=A0A8T1VCI4_9STRA|nr:hypothetical protein PHYPSEUDO_011015 [Phytophthora pseudosyringae]